MGRPCRPRPSWPCDLKARPSSKLCDRTWGAVFLAWPGGLSSASKRKDPRSTAKGAGGASGHLELVRTGRGCCLPRSLSVQGPATLLPLPPQIPDPGRRGARVKAASSRGTSPTTLSVRLLEKAGSTRNSPRAPLVWLKRGLLGDQTQHQGGLHCR